MKVLKMVKLGLVLAFYATIACVGLAFVYTATKDTIAGHDQKKLEAALDELFPDSDNYEEITGTIPSPDSAVTFSNQYKILKNGAVIGAAIQASAGSYGGPIVAIVGVGNDGKVTRIKILQNQDTPGLGAKASSPQYFVNRSEGITFYGQFAGKSVNDPFQVKNDVAAITASTITSSAVTTAVKAASQAGFEWLKSQGGTR